MGELEFHSGVEGCEVSLSVPLFVGMLGIRQRICGFAFAFGATSSLR
jgi:hypothetical protein